MRTLLCTTIAALAIATACTSRAPDSSRGIAPSADLDSLARTYVRAALALGDRDEDSLDSYSGPPEWMAEARRRHTALAGIRDEATALRAALQGLPRSRSETDDARQTFLIRQLEALIARIAILGGERPPFDDEARALFGLDASRAVADHDRIRGALERALPGTGDLAARYAAFDRRFVVPADRLPAVFDRAIEKCRAITLAHVRLPAGERVVVEYVPGLPWSAFTRYEGHFTSRIRVNAALPLTVDRALDLACHEAYPGHHTIKTLIDDRLAGSRPELSVQLLFSPQSALHEAAASAAPDLTFSEPERAAFERNELFALAGFARESADRYVHVSRLVDSLYPAEARIARQYLDGALDFPRASAALREETLTPSADATLKFLNQFRSYAATYTVGRERLTRLVGGDWDIYLRLVTADRQALPGPGAGNSLSPR